MTNQPTLPEARKMQEAEVEMEMYGKLQREDLSATAAEKVRIRKNIDIVLASIRR